MRLFALSSALVAALACTQSASAASIYAGHAIAASTCAQCHGITTPASGAPFPPLAGRDADYLKTALKQYRDKTRVSDVMNNIAGSLSDSNIDNVVAYYARLKP
jgi:cytochrome c553